MDACQAEEQLSRKLHLGFEQVDSRKQIEIGSPHKEDIFIDLDDLLGVGSENMASESLAQFAKRRNIEKMTVLNKAASAEGSQEPPSVVTEVAQANLVESVQLIPEPTVEETAAEQRAEKRPAKSSEIVEQSIEKRPRPSPHLDLTMSFVIQSKAKGSVILTGASVEETTVEQRAKKRPAKSFEIVEQPLKKRPRPCPPLDLATSFLIQPKAKGSIIPIGASVVKDPAVALGVAVVIGLPVDKAVFCAKLGYCFFYFYLFIIIPGFLGPYFLIYFRTPNVLPKSVIASMTPWN